MFSVCTEGLKKELKFHLTLDSSGRSCSTSLRGDVEEGVMGPLEVLTLDSRSTVLEPEVFGVAAGALAAGVSSSESSLLSEAESEPESELELALLALGGASPGGLGGLWFCFGGALPLLLLLLLLPDDIDLCLCVRFSTALFSSAG